MIGWLLDTNVIAEIISQGGSSRVKAWAAGQDEATLHLSILLQDVLLHRRGPPTFFSKLNSAYTPSLVAF